MKKTDHMKSLIRFLIIGIILISTINITYSQEEEKDKRPVRAPFESGYLIDNQTVQIFPKNTLELVIHHRFGTIENGKEDLWGLYAPSNIRFGFNYSILDNLMIGIGTTKNKKYQDIQWKYNIFQQTRSGSTPVGITYFGNIAFDARSEDVLGTSVNTVKRMSYFNQLIITKKFNDFLSIQVAPSITHFNLVDSLAEHDKIGISVGGRYKFSAQTSFIFNYDHPLVLENIQEHTTLLYEPKPNISFGIEFSTSTHAFQIFLATAAGIINQENMMYNFNEFNNEGILLGFNITRLWSF
ncbi:DUF5777 family beta-barrel protein [candidate division KSB1 bacterium]